MAKRTQPTMTIQDALDAMGSAAQTERSRYHVTLGELIEELTDVDGDLAVEFEDGESPWSLRSYRGYYEDLAFSGNSESVTVDGVLDEAESALGESFTGYKGGDFVMNERTPLWKAEWGYTGEAIIGVDVTEDRVVLITKDV